MLVLVLLLLVVSDACRVWWGIRMPPRHCPRCSCCDAAANIIAATAAAAAVTLEVGRAPVLAL